MKTCSRCKEEKSLSLYRKNKSKVDGYDYMCKKCRNRYDREWRKGKGKVKYYTYHRKYESTSKYKNKKKKYRRKPEVMERQRVRVKEDYKKYPEKMKARHLASRLSSPTNCERCKKKNKKLHKHHYDYSKPLDVIFLCTICHGFVHRKYKNL